MVRRHLKNQNKSNWLTSTGSLALAQDLRAIHYQLDFRCLKICILVYFCNKATITNFLLGKAYFIAELKSENSWEVWDSNQVSVTGTMAMDAASQ